MSSPWSTLDELAAAAEPIEPPASGELLSLEQTAVRLGVPAAQLARWCADGSIAPHAFVGSALGTIQFRPVMVDALAVAIGAGAVRAPETW